MDRLCCAALHSVGQRPMIPLADENPLRSFPWMTWLLFAGCILVFFVVQPVGRSTLQLGVDRVDEQDLEFTLGAAAVPCEVIKGRPLSEAEVEATFEDGDASACGMPGPAHSPGKHVYLALLVSMFLHGNLAHLGGNLLFLWVFGNNVEDRKGPWWYAFVYLASGIAASAAHFAIDPNSTVPIVGASGAIAGVMGAYVVWFPRARIKCLVPLVPFILFRKISAGWVLGLWFVSQFLLIGGDSGVAWAAHVGGFAFGALVGLLWRSRRASSPPPVPAGYPGGAQLY